MKLRNALAPLISGTILIALSVLSVIASEGDITAFIFMAMIALAEYCEAVSCIRHNLRVMRSRKRSKGRQKRSRDKRSRKRRSEALKRSEAVKSA